MFSSIAVRKVATPLQELTCHMMWHVSSCSGVATLRTAIHLLHTYLLSNPNALVAVIKGIQAVKLCTNKILQFLIGAFQLTQVGLYNGRKTVVVVVLATLYLSTAAALCCRSTAQEGLLNSEEMQRLSGQSLTMFPYVCGSCCYCDCCKHLGCVQVGHLVCTPNEETLAMFC